MKAAQTAPPAPRQGATNPLERLSKTRAWNHPVSKLLMADTDTREVGRSINDCSTFLKLLMELPLGGDPYAHLLDHNRCNRRLCPWCEKRRAIARQRRIEDALNAFAVDHPKHRAVMVTLTMRNCEIVDLRETLRNSMKAFSRLRKLAAWPTEFWVRKTEITYPLKHLFSNFQPQTPPPSPDEPGPVGPRWAHPHHHLLLMVPPSYWSRDYVSHLTWQKMWMESGRYDYPPVVHVTAFRSTAVDVADPTANHAAAMECGKYITKAADYVLAGAALPEIHWQTSGVRLFAVSKAMQQYLPDTEFSEEELNDRISREAHPGSTFAEALATWCEPAQAYELT